MSDSEHYNNETVKSEPKQWTRKLVLTTEEDFHTANQLQAYFVLRDECPFDLNMFINNEMNYSSYVQNLKKGDRKFCPSAADYLLCFPSTPANETIHLKCPYREGLQVKDENSKIVATQNYLYDFS